MTATTEGWRTRWGELLHELHGALMARGEQSRPVVRILEDLEAVRCQPGTRNLHRPCPWLPEWHQVPEGGRPSPLEAERREWVRLGWVPPAAEDTRREAERAAREQRMHEENARLTAEIIRRETEAAKSDIVA